MAQSFPVTDLSQAVVGKVEAGMSTVYPAGADDNLSYTNTYDYPDAFSQQAKAPDPDSALIQSARYPMKDEGDHFIRFFINLNEESKLIKSNSVITTGYVDNRDQNRSNTNTTDINAVSAGVTTVAGTAAAVGGASLGAKFLKNLFQSKVSKLGAAATIAGTSTAAGVGNTGASIGDQVNSILSETFGLQNKLKRLAANITLYTPAEVRSDYSFSYDMPSNLLVTLSQSQNYEAMKSGLNQFVSALTDLEPGRAAEIAGTSAGKFGRILATGGSQTAQLLSRTAKNSRKDVLFQYVGNRQFRFNFVFAPRSLEEAFEVYRIIWMFKYFSHPEMLPGYGNFLYLYPAEFDIEYGLRTLTTSGNSESNNRYINKISSCVVDNISVDYAPGGSFQSLQNGEPVITTLGLSFREIETLHRDRIAKDY